MAYTAHFETTEIREVFSIQRTRMAHFETSAPADSARGDRVHARFATADCSNPTMARPPHAPSSGARAIRTRGHRRCFTVPGA
jgi:hypothetical protein